MSTIIFHIVTAAIVIIVIMITSIIIIIIIIIPQTDAISPSDNVPSGVKLNGKTLLRKYHWHIPNRLNTLHLLYLTTDRCWTSSIESPTTHSSLSQPLFRSCTSSFDVHVSAGILLANNRRATSANSAVFSICSTETPEASSSGATSTSFFKAFSVLSRISRSATANSIVGGFDCAGLGCVQPNRVYPHKNPHRRCLSKAAGHLHGVFSISRIPARLCRCRASDGINATVLLLLRRMIFRQ